MTKPVKFQAIPYSTWDNRKPGPMVVWLPEKSELAELPGEEGAVTANGVRIRASHVNPSDTLADLTETQAIGFAFEGAQHVDGARDDLNALFGRSVTAPGSPSHAWFCHQGR